MTAAYKTDPRLLEALRDVSDPELPLSVVDMGLIYGVWQEESIVYIKLTYTSMGCPCAEFILEDVRERLLREDGVAQVDIEIVWDPPWSKRMLSQDARDTLLEFGVAT
ncbi:MAG: metal-sulfur cluster assembly factor [Roseiflexaceae bacterium]